jgi:hypothetical protein
MKEKFKTIVIAKTAIALMMASLCQNTDGMQHQIDQLVSDFLEEFNSSTDGAITLLSDKIFKNMLLESKQEILKIYAPQVVNILCRSYREPHGISIEGVHHNFLLNDIAKEYFFPLFPKANSTSLFAALSAPDCYKILYFVVMNTYLAKKNIDVVIFVRNCFGSDKGNLDLAYGIPNPPNDICSQDFLDAIFSAYFYPAMQIVDPAE